MEYMSTCFSRVLTSACSHTHHDLPVSHLSTCQPPHSILFQNPITLHTFHAGELWPGKPSTMPCHRPWFLRWGYWRCTREKEAYGCRQPQIFQFIPSSRMGNWNSRDCPKVRELTVRGRKVPVLPDFEFLTAPSLSENKTRL